MSIRSNFSSRREGRVNWNSAAAWTGPYSSRQHAASGDLTRTGATVGTLFISVSHAELDRLLSAGQLYQCGGRPSHPCRPSTQVGDDRVGRIAPPRRRTSRTVAPAHKPHPGPQIRASLAAPGLPRRSLFSPIHRVRTPARGRVTGKAREGRPRADWPLAVRCGPALLKYAAVQTHAKVLLKARLEFRLCQEHAAACGGGGGR